MRPAKSKIVLRDCREHVAQLFHFLQRTSGDIKSLYCSSKRILTFLDPQ